MKDSVSRRKIVSLNKQLRTERKKRMALELRYHGILSGLTLRIYRLESRTGIFDDLFSIDMGSMTEEQMRNVRLERKK